MRKFLTVVLASTFLTSVPAVVSVQEVQAASLFEKLFPRVVERRRERRARRALRQKQIFDRQRAQERARERARQRALNRERKKAAKKKKIVKIAKVKGASFKVYSPTPLRVVSLAGLSKAFSAYDQKVLAAEAIRQEKLKLPVEEVSATGSVVDVKPTLVSQTVDNETDAKPLDSIRLSAGSRLLKSIKLPTERALGKSLVSHYRKNPTFMWVDGEGKPNERAQAALDVLKDANAFALRAEDYAVPMISVSDEATEDDFLRAAMKFEFALTIATLQYISDARHGIVDPNKISGYHDFKGLRSDFKKRIAEVRNAEDVAQLMLGAHPQEKAFEALKAELSDLQEKVSGFDAVVIKPGTFIRPGQTNDQVENIVESIRRKASPELLSDHFDAFAVDHSEGLYTEDVVALVRDFQKSMKLKPDGIVGKNTIARMQGDNPKVQLGKVRYAMERLRWHPDRLGNKHVFINQPAYRATYMNNGRPQLSMRAVVGKPSNQTNFFHDKIEYVEYNPYWGIPRSILVNEMLPKLRRNPGYFDRIGYEITNTRGKRISSSSVNWSSVGADFPYNVRQPPGGKNALGELKIMFPNKHSIYMHDTPAKSLFKRSKRAFSHGCVRLAEPRAMAAAVLGSNISTISSKLADGENKQQRLKRKIPVYVAYFTAWPDSSGNVKYFGDVYGRDKALEKAMALEHKVRSRAKGA